MIVVFGSINVDGVTTVARRPEPGETVVDGTHRTLAGGKGANQAVAAARAGADVCMIGCVGNDDLAGRALGGLLDAGVDVTRVERRDGVATGYASVWVDGQGGNAIIVAGGANREARADQVEEVLLTPDATVLLQLELRVAETEAAIARARARGARVVLNAAPYAPLRAEILSAVDILVVNEVEAEGLAAHLDVPGGRPTTLARQIGRRFGLTCIVTLGAEGVVAWEPTGAFRLSSLPVEVEDTTGAGDAFVGGVAAALERGLGLAEALPLATVGGALACTRPGAQEAMPDLARLEAEVPHLAQAVRIDP